MRLLLATILTITLLGCPEDDPPGDALVTVIPGKDAVESDSLTPTDVDPGEDTPSETDSEALTDVSKDVVANTDSDNKPDTTKPAACTSDSDCVEQLKLTACQTAICEDGKCSADAMPEGTSCNDDIPCTVEDVCSNGECKGTPNCDDDNPCTDDFCNLNTGTCKTIFNTEPCDDGNPCSKPDVCKQGECKSTLVECPPCKTVEDCKSLDDGNACNGTLKCDEGKCVTDPSTVIDCSDAVSGPCESLTCNPDTGLCQSEPLADGTACDTQSICDFGGSCVGGECVAIPKDCDDNNPCTEDQCDPDDGCEHIPSTELECSDDNACTLDDKCTEDATCEGTPMVCDAGSKCLLSVCVDGECVTKVTGENSCDDNNPCTTDSCNADGDCVNTVAPNEACDDEDPCTLADQCNEKGICEGEAKKCPEKQSCNKKGECVGDPMSCAGHCGDQAPGGCWCDELCDEVKDCCEDACEECPKDVDPLTCCEPDCAGKVCGDDGCGGTCGTCTDNDPCTLDGCSQDGKCEFKLKPCKTPDNNQCITASCNPESGECVEEEITCGTSDACVQKKCLPQSGCVTTTTDCNDNNSCTIDKCLAPVGCINEGPKGKKCDNNGQCEQKNKCVLAACTSCGVCEETPVQCEDDDNPCTETQCDSKKGCVTKALQGKACDSNDKCVVNTTCDKNGECSGGEPTCELGSEESPAQSCRHIQEDDPTKESGVYWLKPQLSGESFQVYCEMKAAGGGWMRVVKVGGEIPICGLSLEFGDPAELLQTSGKTAIMGLKQAIAAPFSKEVLVTTNTGNSVHYKSKNKGFTWANIANGVLHSANISGYAVQASINGAKFATVNKTTKGPKGGLLMGGLVGGKTGIFMGVGGFYSGNYVMDNGCTKITGHDGMYAGNAFPVQGWGMSGAIYIR